MLSSFGIVVVTYLFFSARVGNYINVLSPILFFQIPAYFALEPLHLYLFGPSGSNFAYFYCYLTYTLEIVALAIGYLAVPARLLRIFLRIPKLVIPGAPYLVLLAGLALYTPILIKYSQYISDPRRIYALTRTGYGLEFFLSSFAIYLALVLLLFSGKRHTPLRFLFMGIASLLLYLHGSKGQVLYFFLILLYFVVFVKQVRFGPARMMTVVAGLVAVIIALFYLTFSPAGRADFLESIAGYSDYTRNAMLVIDDPRLPIQYGRLTFQESAYALVPRTLFPEKPRNFGALWLAQRYFPERYAADTGAPAFGIGVGYADFGYLAFIYYAVTWMVAGMFMKVLVTRLKERPDAGTFVLLLVMLQVPLIPAGAKVPLLAYYMCALGVRCISRDQVSDIKIAPLVTDTM
jgi:hypothetical protein